MPSTVPDTQNTLNKFSSITDITANSTVGSFCSVNGLSHLKPKSKAKKTSSHLSCSTLWTHREHPRRPTPSQVFPAPFLQYTCHWFPVSIAVVTFPCMWSNLTGKAKSSAHLHTHPAHTCICVLRAPPECHFFHPASTIIRKVHYQKREDFTGEGTGENAEAIRAD